MRLARATSGRERVTDDASFSVEELADKSRSAHRLLYRTPPLLRRLTLSGFASVRLEVSFDAPASNLSVALVDLGPKGGTTVLSEGWADPQNIDSLHEGTALEPRTRYAIEVDLDQVLQHRLPSGHRLALVVAASDRSSPSARRRGRTSGSPSPRRRSTSRCSEAPTPCATRCGHERGASASHHAAVLAVDDERLAVAQTEVGDALGVVTLRDAGQHGALGVRRCRQMRHDRIIQHTEAVEGGRCRR
ncbi:MAG: hypothetical protein H0V59_05390 [Nocardioidaceae bacterium]|nr:hypothetical protein [Nocardioidaceae bacterium]